MDQDRVPGRMAVGVIDPLHAIDIEIEQTRGRAVAPPPTSGSINKVARRSVALYQPVDLRGDCPLNGTTHLVWWS